MAGHHLRAIEFSPGNLYCPINVRSKAWVMQARHSGSVSWRSAPTRVLGYVQMYSYPMSNNRDATTRPISTSLGSWCAVRSTGAITRVLVVEDHEPFRRYVCTTLHGHVDLQVIGEPEDGLQAVQHAEALQPDLILLDIGLPQLNGIGAARLIRKVAPNARIIFLTQESSAEVVHEALSLGAWGYVLKAQAQNDLLAAISAVASGERFISSGLDGTGEHPKPKP